MTALLDLFVKGGICMYPLALFSIVAIALIAERSLFWFKINRRQGKMVRDVLRAYRDSTDMALKKLELEADLPIARIFLNALELERPNVDEFRLALESSAQAEIPVMKRFNNVFDTIVTLAPLLGLLGTVTGLMASFAAIKIGEFSAEQTSTVSNGISEALITTAAGLIIAIFVSVFANAFKGLYQQQIATIQEYGGQLELVFRRYHDTESAVVSDRRGSHATT